PSGGTVMADFVIPVDFRINTMGGQLDIPAGATVHTHPDGTYAGWTPSLSRAESAGGAIPPLAEPSVPTADDTHPSGGQSETVQPAEHSDQTSAGDPVLAPDA